MEPPAKSVLFFTCKFWVTDTSREGDGIINMNQSVDNREFMVIKNYDIFFKFINVTSITWDEGKCSVAGRNAACSLNQSSETFLVILLCKLLSGCQSCGGGILNRQMSKRACLSSAKINVGPDYLFNGWVKIKEEKYSTQKLIIPVKK